LSFRSRFLFILATVWTIFFVYTMRATRGVHPLYPLVPPDTQVIPQGTNENFRGRIQGELIWEGELPEAPLFLVPNVPLMPRNLAPQKNPHLPKVNADRLENGIVWLEGVDPQRSKKWDHPPLKVVAQGYQIETQTEERKSFFIGFVPVGSTIELVSVENEWASIRGRGAENFTVMLPQNGLPVRRTLGRKGWIELSSASGFYWARNWLFVLDHPYVTRSSPNGTFTLEGVPTGTYTLNVWHPNWQIVRIDKDPETGAPVRVEYAAPMRIQQRIKVEETGEPISLIIRMSAQDFPKGSSSSR
jgi:hypothetical protein